jgi:hypothetical protein
MKADLINGIFELIGGILCWKNFFQLLKDKEVKGVSLSVMVFFCFFSGWNMYYYPLLNQICSFVGALFLLLGNCAWVILAFYYQNLKRS